MVVYLKPFAAWLDEQGEDLRLRTLAHLELLKTRGPQLGRPYADTLKGSKITNLKELRFQFDGAPIRVLFVFDPRQQAVIMLAGNKQGDKRWYETNIATAEKLYYDHLAELEMIDAERTNKE